MVTQIQDLNQQLAQLNSAELLSLLRKQFLTRGNAPQAHLMGLLIAPSSSSRNRSSEKDLVDAVARRDDVDAAAIDAVLDVPHLGSAEAGNLLRNRGVLGSSNTSDALRKLAQDGRLIGFLHDRRWRYPTFQLEHIDPRDETNVVVVVNRLLDAGRYPWSATSWWTTPSGSLADYRAPAELLGSDEERLLQLARAAAAGPDL